MRPLSRPLFTAWRRVLAPLCKVAFGSREMALRCSGLLAASRQGVSPGIGHSKQLYKAL